jgi:hypothetical protein
MKPVVDMAWSDLPAHLWLFLTAGLPALSMLPQNAIASRTAKKTTSATEMTITIHGCQ